MITLETNRLLLRPWRDTDRGPFAALNADPSVMRYEPCTLSREESDAKADQIQRALPGPGGGGVFAIETRAAGDVLGFVNVEPVTFEANFTPATEIGWRLARRAWGQGLASEAAHAIVTWAFRDLPLSELVAIAVSTNHRSRAVMERLGMRHDPREDFEHPLMPVASSLRRHVLYRLTAADVHAPTHGARTGPSTPAGR